MDTPMSQQVNNLLLTSQVAHRIEGKSQLCRPLSPSEVQHGAQVAKARERFGYSPHLHYAVANDLFLRVESEIHGHSQCTVSSPPTDLYKSLLLDGKGGGYIV